METLMKNLQEQHNLQLQEQELHAANDLTNMETINESEPQLPPRPKYVSIFRIDGEPILPPLMTTEKRRQMQKIKEKAVKVEQLLTENKQRINKENEECSKDVVSVTSRSSLCNTAGNVSQRSQESFATNLKETEESMMVLQNLLEKQEEDRYENVEKVDCGSNTTAPPPIVDENLEKLQKLRKSEILIYDNSTKEIIQVPPDKESGNLIYSKANKPNHLLLAGVDGKGMTSIPSICLNPPTPLTGNRSISENLQPSDSIKSILVTDKYQKTLNLTEDSSDESFSSMLTHSNGRSSINQQNKPKHSTQGLTEVTEGGRNKKPYKKSMIVSNKIQQFEDLSSGSNTTSPASPEKAYYHRRNCVMSRSATSPSIKFISSNQSSSRSQNLDNDSGNSADITLVRSSSFTLEAPSKALIDHMRQQKSINEAKANAESHLNSTRTLTRKPLTPPLRAHRDTVESKAKKVQKVELKSSKQKLQQKTSQSKLAQAAVASLSFYNTSSLTQKSSNVIKTKKSPYDTTKYSQQSLPKSTATSSQLRKSASTPSSIISNKSTKSPVSTPTSNKTNFPKPSIEKETFSQMDKIQKDKFLRLLAQQEEEHRRLQQSFEMQQKLLLQQLNREMVTTQLQSPTKSNNSSSQKRPEYYHNNQSANKLHNQLNFSGLSADTKSDKKQSYAGPQPQQSPTISNNSFNLSITHNSQTQSTSALQSSFSLHSTHPPPSSSSAANTSLELSTLSNQTSPDTLCATTTPTNKQTPNINGNKSSSRRRLFTGDITSGNGNDTTQLLSFRSTASSSYAAMQRLSEPTEPRITPNKSSMTLSHNGGIRRLYQQDDYIFHDAATKINACARGFLVRRLFQTEQIQRIVQTIRDTLIFVINLHLETLDNYEESNTPANIKLKARLLQQLSSACRTLHLVFFQTSIKERMEIIARDRKRIKTKLLAMNRKRTPRIAG